MKFYFTANDEINVHPKQIKIFSQVKKYDIFTSEKYQVDIISTTCF